MSESVILAGARTPIGKLSGSLSSFTAMQLGAIAIKEALKKANIAPEEVDYVFMGHVIQAGQGQITARQAAAGAGIPMTTPATTVNKVCLSGMNAIYLAHQMIASGDAKIVVAGGMESMTNAPHLLPGARAGYRLGDAKVVDSMMYDGLFCAFDHCAMGLGTERYSRSASISRQIQDELAALSHQRAAVAIKEGKLDPEIVPVEIPQRKGDPVVFTTDEGVRADTTIEALSKLKAAFEDGGSITAGNSSQISDGAAALIITSKQEAEARSIEPLASIIGYGQVAGPDPSLLTQPSRAAMAAIEKAGLKISDVDLFEINEAFAAVVAASVADLGITHEIVNVNGGAIALGHPIGMSGARLPLTLAYELKRRGGGVGVASLCGGGGQGDAIAIKVS